MAIDLPQGLGNSTYEYDYFCLSEDTPLLRRRNSHIEVSLVQDMKDGDEVPSLNKITREIEWKNIRVSRKPSPERLCRIRAKTLFDVTHNHRMIKPDLSEIPAGNLENGDRLLSIDHISLPEEIKSIRLSEALSKDEIPPWLILTETEVGYERKRGRGRAKICQEGFISDEIPLDYETGVFIGLYLAEGSLSPQNSISFAFHENEEELSSLIEKVVQRVFGLKANTRVLPQYTRRVCYIHHKSLSFLWGKTFPGLSYDKEVPSFAFHSPEEFRLGIIHGWLFGDGTFGTRNVIGTSVSRLLAYGIHNLSLSLGIRSSISSEKNSNAFHVIFSSRKTFRKLFSFPVLWKHYPRIREYLDNGNSFSKSSLEKEFRKYYVEGMSKKDFFCLSNISPCPFYRVYSSWSGVLEAHGFSGFGLSANGMSRERFTLLAREWLEENNWDFSIGKWDSDSSVPSQGLIYKFFGSTKSFLNQIKSLAPGDIQFLKDFVSSEFPKEKKKEEGTQITFVEEISYKGSWVYDLEVEDNHNFLIGEVVSHNSGSQIQVFFEEVLVDDCVRIAWGVQQSRQPIYGYASQYYNALADGVIILGGSLWIAFKEATYIPVILRHISARKDPNDPLYGSPAMSPRDGTNHSSTLVQSAQEWRGGTSEGGARRAGLVQRANIERLMRYETANGDDAEAQNLLHQYAMNISAMNDRDFENLAEQFEDAIWYGGNRVGEDRSGGRGETMSGNYRGGELTDDDFLSVRRADQFPPFDIVVNFGDMNNAAANHTVTRLLSVVITNTQFGPIEPSGEPIYVQYDFIGRSMM